MANSSNINHPIPDFGQKGFYEDFTQLVDSLDESDYASRTDRNLAVIGGGTVSMSTSGEVSWTDDFQFIDNITGNEGVLSSDQSPVTLNPGDVAWVNVVRGPVSDYELDIKVSSGSIPNTHKSQALFARYGDKLWIRGRETIDFGNVSSNSDISAVIIPIALNEEVGEGSNTIARYRFNLDELNIPTSNLVFRFKVEAQTVLSGLNGDVELWDVTNPSNEILKANFAISSNQPSEFISVVSPSSVNNNRAYEVRAGLDALGGPYTDSEKLIVWHSTFEVLPT